MSKLVLVPTPIGNLEDITLRAIKVLKEADVILAEDTRKTGILLSKYDIDKKLIPYHQFNEHKFIEKLIEYFNRYNVIALVTDAGTPGISDPGFLIARTCIENDIEIECLPGPTALIPALMLSGLPADKFYFDGFLPHKKGRHTRLKALSIAQSTIILYESPHRIHKTLEQLKEYLGEDRNAAVIKELSKIHETVFRGNLGELADIFTNKTNKGEYVIVVQGCKK